MQVRRVSSWFSPHHPMRECYNGFFATHQCSTKTTAARSGSPCEVWRPHLTRNDKAASASLVPKREICAGRFAGADGNVFLLGTKRCRPHRQRVLPGRNILEQKISSFTEIGRAHV